MATCLMARPRCEDHHSPDAGDGDDVAGDYYPVEHNESRAHDDPAQNLKREFALEYDRTGLYQAVPPVG